MEVYKGTITRRMESALSGLQKEIRGLYSRSDFENKIKALQKASGSERPSKLKLLYVMLDNCGISYEKGRKNSYYEHLIRNADIPSFSEIEDRMLRALFINFQSYPTPEVYMERIVERLCCEDDPWKEDTLRIRILKQFIKYGNSLTYIRKYTGEDGESRQEKVILYGGEAYIKKYLKKKTGHAVKYICEYLEEIEDDIFEVLEKASKVQKKPSGPYGLLKIADDLATGQFRKGGGTKKSLYLFAIVYGMTYYSGGMESGLSLQYSTDIEQNLFQDYYANNLMRFLSKSYRKKLCEYDLDPAGQGINYKNYAEMVYLYYMTKDISPQEKIKAASEMIRDIPKIQREYWQEHRQEHWQKHGIGAKTNPNSTAFYRKAFRNDSMDPLFSEDILSLPETEFVEFICRNYNCDTGNGNYMIGEMQLETEQRTAYQIYETLITELIVKQKEKSGKIVDYDYDFSKLTETEKEAERRTWLGEYQYGLWFIDTASFQDPNDEQKRQKLCERIFKGLSEEEKMLYTKETADQFITLLFAAAAYIGDKKALYVSSESEMTRTVMIVAYYYYFNALYENNDYERRKNFEELFHHFADGVNEYLENAYYQPLSGRNIFDVLVVFSSYVYLHDFML